MEGTYQPKRLCLYAICMLPLSTAKIDSILTGRIFNYRLKDSR